MLIIIKKVKFMTKSIKAKSRINCDNNSKIGNNKIINQV